MDDMILDSSEFMDQLYRSSYRDLYIYARVKLQKHDLAEESVQETFRIACTRPEFLQSCANPRGWLVETLKRVMMDLQGRRARDIDLLAAISGHTPEQLSAFDEEKVEVIYHKEMQDPDFCMLVRFSVHGDSLAVISRDTGLSIAAVKKRLERTRKKYREILD